jgi:hypothetical protein
VDLGTSPEIEEKVEIPFNGLGTGWQNLHVQIGKNFCAKERNCFNRT